MIHIGEVIRKELQRQERTVSWFAKHLYCDRSNAYDIFKRVSLDTELLFRISQLLQRDFFQCYSTALRPSEPTDKPRDGETIPTKV